MKTLILLLSCFWLPEIFNEIPDGTIIAKEHSKKIVERVTQSPTTHVGIIFNEDETAYVYEAAPPVVRRVPIEKYYEELIEYKRSNPKLEILIAKPKISFTDVEIRSMKSLADSQLGRKYSVKPYVRGESKSGIHCAQYVCDVLTRSRRFWSQNSAVVTPESLWQSIDEKFTKYMINIPNEDLEKRKK